MTGQTIAKILACAAIGYALGCLSPSYLVGRVRGYDVRKSGSGNAGATNTMLMAGKLAGLLVALADILKAAAAWWLCQWLFPELSLARAIGGVSAALGHMFPFYLRFHGGKGFACLGGIIFGYSPRVFLLMLGVALLIAFITNYVCISAVSMSVIWPAYYGFVTRDIAGVCVLVLPFFPIFFKHLENFRRIRTGGELRFSYLWKKDEELRRIGRL